MFLVFCILFLSSCTTKEPTKYELEVLDGATVYINRLPHGYEVGK